MTQEDDGVLVECWFPLNDFKIFSVEAHYDPPEDEPLTLNLAALAWHERTKELLAVTLATPETANKKSYLLRINPKKQTVSYTGPPAALRRPIPQPGPWFRPCDPSPISPHEGRPTALRLWLHTANGTASMGINPPTAEGVRGRAGAGGRRWFWCVRDGWQRPQSVTQQSRARGNALDERAPCEVLSVGNSPPPPLSFCTPCRSPGGGGPSLGQPKITSKRGC